MSDQNRFREGLKEGTFIPAIDFNMAIWIAYLNCVDVKFIPTHIDYATTVAIVCQLMLPDWEDEDYRKDMSAARGKAIYMLRAVTNLLHRRKFFEHTEKVDLIG